MTVRLWLADLDVEAPTPWLSPDEQARRDRFVFPVHRHRFARGRSLLRGVLGRVLGIDAAEVAFSYNPQGRPEVPGLHFNISHADHQLLIALGPAPLGVDIEAARPMADQRGVARTAFSSAELAAWDGSPEAFYRLWTRKEALMKAHGLGFVMDSRSFTLSLAAGPQVHGAFTVLDLPAPAGFHAALAFAGDVPALETKTL
jgi:4'-phosphopantetheinyl transferase